MAPSRCGESPAGFLDGLDLWGDDEPHGSADPGLSDGFVESWTRTQGIGSLAGLLCRMREGVSPDLGRLNSVPSPGGFC